jgi:hypothetical protein
MNESRDHIEIRLIYRALGIILWKFFRVVEAEILRKGNVKLKISIRKLPKVKSIVPLIWRRNDFQIHIHFIQSKAISIVKSRKVRN